MHRVADKLYRIEAGGFVNAYLIEGRSDLTMVDAGHSRAAREMLAEIKENGFRVRDIGRIVVTHAHADHVGGIEAFVGDRRIRVYAHPSEIPVLKGTSPQHSFKGVRGFGWECLHEQFLPWPPVKNVMPMEPGTTLHGIPQWQVLHTPGHTDGSISLFHPASQILICGDVLSNRGGRLHVPAGCFNQNPRILRRSLEELAKLDCDVLCCGHGPIVRGGAFRHIEAVLARRKPPRD